MALITTTDVTNRATAKDIDITSMTTYIQDIIDAAQKYIEAVTGNIFDEQTITQTWSGAINNLTDVLMTDYYPITEVTSLTIDDTLQTEDDDFYITNIEVGIIHTESYLPSTGYNNIVLEYKAGYNPSHPTVAEICLNMVLNLIQMDPSGVKYKNYTDGDFQAAFTQSNELDLLLEPFKRPSMHTIIG